MERQLRGSARSLDAGKALAVTVLVVSYEQPSTTRSKDAFRKIMIRKFSLFRFVGSEMPSSIRLTDAA